MRVIAATVDLAEKYGTSVTCLWESNSELGADFLDLFKEPKRFNISSKNEGKLLSSYKTSAVKRIIAKFWNSLRGLDYYFSAENVDRIVTESGVYDFRLFFQKIEPLVAAKKNICFVSGNYLADLKDVSMFEPKDEIMMRINEYACKFNEHTYGLHIRRTDNRWAIEHSPISMFCEVIEKKLKDEPDAKFYLSTDDPETVEFLKTKYENFLIIRPKHYGRENIEAMEDAVIDMWILSKTKSIFGSYFSSFSEMAALLGGRNVLIMKFLNE